MFIWNLLEITVDVILLVVVMSEIVDIRIDPFVYHIHNLKFRAIFLQRFMSRQEAPFEFEEHELFF